MADQSSNPTPIAPISPRTEYVENIGGVLSPNLHGRGEQLGMLTPKEGHAKFSGEAPTAAARHQTYHSQQESNGARFAIAAAIAPSSPPTRGDLDVNTYTIASSGSVQRDFWASGSLR